MSELIRSMTVLQVADLQRSLDFYTGRLGFSSHGSWGDPPCFAIVQRGAVTFALDETRETGAPVPGNQYWAAYLYVTGVRDLLESFRKAGVPIERELEETPYGLLDFDIRDPDGHVIAFGEDLQPRPGVGPGLARLD
ncbi:MAG: VOC family protein [Minwuia sp.]|uniref:VOC family protein n=1 Tax=Minwuia sp. TaxID=2493630 RepID=UPI003A851433